MNGDREKMLLLVEDEGDVAKVESRLLERCGYKVMLAASGEQAVELVRAGEVPFDLILMDIDLGSGMDGTAAARKILEICDLPIVFLSSHDDPEFVSRTERIASYGYILKGCGTSVLAASIRMALDLHDANRRLREKEAALRLIREELEKRVLASTEDLVLTNHALRRENAERRRIEQDLRNSEERYRKIIDLAPWAIIVHSEGRIVYSNRPAAALFGFPEERRQVGSPVISLVHPERRKRVWDLVTKEHAAGDRPLTFTDRFLTLDGRSFYGEVLSVAVEFGGKKAVMAFVRDVTERKRSEDKLAASEAKYRTLFENMVQGVFYQLPDGSFSDVNPSALRMFGLTRSQFLGMTFANAHWQVIDERGSVVPTDEYPSNLVFRTGKTVRHSVMGIYNHEKNDFVWADVNAVPQFGEGEKAPARVFVTLMDITEKRRKEEAARETSIMHEDYYENAPDMYFSVDSATVTVSDCNRSMLERTGYGREELIGRSLFDLYHPDCTDRMLEVVRLFDERREIRDLELELKKKDGGKILVTVNAKTTFDELGMPTCTRSILHDITEQKRAELMLLEAQREKESLLCELHEKVKNSLALISELSRPPSEGAPASMPRRDILGGLVFPSRRKGSVRLDRYVSETANALYNSMVPEAGRISLQMKLDEIVTDARNCFPVSLILDELLKNSFKHAFPDGRTGRIMISLENRGPEASLAVGDNGIGLPEGFRIERSESFGLQLIRMLAEEVHGRMEYEPAGGTLFRILLPLHR